MPFDVNFSSLTKRAAVVQAVYFKDAWDSAWIEAPWLWCQAANWSMAPTISTAEIVYRYGNYFPRGGSAWARLAPGSLLRWYVAVDYYTYQLRDEQTLRTWYGIVDVELDELFAPEVASEASGTHLYPRGRNHHLAFGMESLLAASTIDRAAIQSGSGGGVSFVPKGLTFNLGLAHLHPDRPVTTREGNRSSQTVDAGVYVFHESRTGGDKWTTRDIVEYLLRFNAGRDHEDNQRLTWVLDDAANALPFWDEPILNSEGLTVYEALNQLISRQRGLGWRVEVRPSDANQGGDQLAVVPCTFLSEFLQAGNVFLTPNPRQLQVSWESDRGQRPVVKRSSIDTVDQVVVQSEPRTSTATFCFENGTLAKGWTDEREQEYETGASESGDYPGADETSQREFLNDLARSADKFAAVFARFVPPDPMGGYVGDGEGIADQVLMPSDHNVDEPMPHAPDDQKFLAQLALLEGVNYAGQAIKQGLLDTGLPHKYLPPLVVFPLTPPDPQAQSAMWAKPEIMWKLMNSEIGWELNYPPPATIRVENDGALWVKVSGEPQLVIAGTDFTPLEEDKRFYSEDDTLPADYQQMLATLTVPWSQRAEGRYPPQTPVGGDVSRRMLIEVPFHRVDYVVPGTVVAINEETGELIRSESGGFVRDDRPLLTNIAVLAYTWYGKARKAVQFSTTLINNFLQVGDLVLTIGNAELAGTLHVETINAVITHVRIISPLAEGEGDVVPPVPRIEYLTDYGELDPLSLVTPLYQ